MYFSKIAKVTLFTTIITLSSMSTIARENTNKRFNWGPLMDAITQVESEGNSRAVSGNQCGAMQITPILVEDCNAILKKRGEKKRFTLNDRFSVKRSREMFVLIMSHYNPTNNIEKAIRIWNGGVNYTNKGTQRYYKKVMALYKQ
ncbi:MAG: lytic transglycosylase domain-containing protein [Prevotella sp.]|nr:lytic transglycosylase domain-containing protein [Prevotella sp.]